MSSESSAPKASPANSRPPREGIRIYSHSNLFYWWPVWVMGFLMAFLTWLDGHRLAVVPKGTEARRDIHVETAPGQVETREALLLPADGKHHLPPATPVDGNLPAPEQPLRLISASHTYGVLFCITLLAVILITNVPLRGLWSVVVIITVVLLSIILALTKFWDQIIHWIGLLDVRINVGGYLFIATALFLLWIVTMLFFDRQMFLEFTPGQLKVCTEIGGGEKTYDTMGMTVEKKRSDLFRHWILGLGSGDLTVNTSGAAVQHLDLPNVLFINTKIRQIEDMLRERKIVAGQ